MGRAARPGGHAIADDHERNRREGDEEAKAKKREEEERKRRESIAVIGNPRENVRASTPPAVLGSISGAVAAPVFKRVPKS
mgnify:CR=1 FL=1